MSLAITIADDSLLSRKNVRKAVPSELDANISEASNGVEALAQVNAGNAELLFLDLQMPVLDGFGVLEALQKQNANTIVIVISADIQPLAVERVYKLGAFKFLQKPLDPTQLRAALVEVGLL